MMRMLKSMLFGLVVGTAIGIIMFPDLDRRTQRSIRKAKKRAMCMAGDCCDNLMYNRNR